MTVTIPQGKRMGESQEASRCAKCGAQNRRLVMDIPADLSLKEKQEYTGELYCNSHLPLFEQLPTKSFESVL